ncbi:sterol desaturase family protein [Methylobacterium sp. WL120]|uniref:sterol desaturase family protein n=1 Tax=Methylobacterium sp. WL120 TaxID=2603887 RepID=UPI0011CB399B|nr:sterol desaturase family protein [Methylobacterium sp. WL120]TXM70713.1 sterol desaturase family protein [Methylobacterium sp. WL120]
MRLDRNRQSGFRLGRFELVTGAVVAIGALAIVVAEHRRPLRRRTQAEPNRELVNLAMGAASALAIMAAETPLVGPLARIAEERDRGLVRRLPLPEWGRDVAGLLLMDYTFYLWHVLTHKVSLLWRLHLVHHVDLDLDASTALRFHALDMVVSAPWRAGQVALIGLSPRGLRLWQRFFFLSILFHHSNLRLPEGLERRLAWVLTTPRMHGIHHSAAKDETESNWSSGFSFWDRLHGTFRLDVDQDDIAIGVPAYRDPADTGIGRSLSMPFRSQRDAWTPAPDHP